MNFPNIPLPIMPPDYALADLFRNTADVWRPIRPAPVATGSIVARDTAAKYELVYTGVSCHYEPTPTFSTPTDPGRSQQNNLLTADKWHFDATLVLFDGYYLVMTGPATDAVGTPNQYLGLVWVIEGNPLYNFSVPSGAQPLPVVRRDAAMERADWANLISLKQLTAPWVIVKIEYLDPGEWNHPCGPWVIVQATIWYNVDVPAAEADGQEVVTVIEGRLEALRAALLADQTLGTTLDLIPPDTSADNPVNVTFLDQQVPYQGGSITAQTLVRAVSS